MSWKTQVVTGLTAVARTQPGRRVLHRGSRAGLVPWRVTNGIPIEGLFTVGVGAGFRYRSTARDWIGRNLFWAGLDRWEHETFPEFIRLAKSARTFLDIGANTGAYTLVATAVNPALRAWAFEPVPETAARLAEHVRLNDLDSRVIVVTDPVSDVAGPVSFYVAASPDESKIVAAAYGVGAVTMRATTVDDEVSEPVDLVKMDVEGGEVQVLRGMSRILKHDRPHLIIELLSDVAAQDVLAALPDHYTLWHLSLNGLVPYTNVKPGKDRNYLCVPGGVGQP